MRMGRIITTFVCILLIFSMAMPVISGKNGIQGVKIDKSEPEPVTNAIPKILPINGVYAPIVTDNQNVAFVVAGWCDMAVDVDLEVGTTPDFAIGAGEVTGGSPFITAEDNYASGVYRILASGLIGSTLYQWRLSLTNGGNTIYYPSATTTATAQTTGGISIGFVDNPFAGVVDEVTLSAQYDFLGLFWIKEGGVESFPLSSLGIGTNFISVTGDNNFRSTLPPYSAMSDSGATIHYWGMYGRWLAGGGSPDGELWHSDKMDDIQIGSGVMNFQYETHPFMDDDQPPVTSVDELPEYVIAPITITATATDDISGVAYVELYWKSEYTPIWQWYDTDYTGPYYAWSFDFPDGPDIMYEFYSIGVDYASNVEDPPPVADTYCWPLGHYEAIATGPEGTTDSLDPVYITFDSGCVGPTQLYYSFYSSTGPWIYIADVEWPIESYLWTPPGPGTYYWLAAGGCPDLWWMMGPPPGGTMAEAGPYIITLPPTEWDMYNGQNYRTLSSELTPGWMASDLALDMISNINSNHGEDLENIDIQISKYDSLSGSFQTCYYVPGPNIWFSDFALVEGDSYIISMLNSKLDTQPLNYELPNTQITSEVAVNLYNGQNYRGFPVTANTMASELALDIISYVNTNYAEDLVNIDITITGYDSVGGSFQTCYYVPGPNIWFSDFAISQEAGYIILIRNNKLDTQPVFYVPS